MPSTKRTTKSKAKWMPHQVARSEPRAKPHHAACFLARAGAQGLKGQVRMSRELESQTWKNRHRSTSTTVGSSFRAPKQRALALHSSSNRYLLPKLPPPACPGTACTRVRHNTSACTKVAPKCQVALCYLSSCCHFTSHTHVLHVLSWHVFVALF